jgi:ketosteroid isomerase-like protein
MSDAHKALVRHIYRATETGDVAILDSVMTGDIVEHPLNPGQSGGLTRKDDLRRPARHRPRRSDYQRGHLGSLPGIHRRPGELPSWATRSGG